LTNYFSNVNQNIWLHEALEEEDHIFNLFEPIFTLISVKDIIARVANLSIIFTAAFILEQN